MALAPPIERYAANSAAQGSSTAFSPTTNTTAGSALFLFAGTGAAGKILISVTDTQNNVWVIDNTANNGTQGASVASCLHAIGLTTADTITANFSSATSTGHQIWIQEMAGLNPYTVVDKICSDTKTAQATTAITGGTLATLSQASEIIFGLFRWNNSTTGVAGSGYTTVTTGTLNGASYLEYQIVSATTGIDVNSTSGVNQGAWAGIGATYKALTSRGLPHNIDPAGALMPVVVGNGMWSNI